MVAKEHPSQETLRKYFIVNGLSFIRIKRTGRTTKIGEIISGYEWDNGSLYMKFNNTHFAVHRLLWIYFNGSISNEIQIDHIDGNPKNNLISNLRIATPSQNQHNKKYQGNNTGHKDIIEYNKRKNGKIYYYYKVSVKLNSKINSKNFPHTAEGLINAIEHRNYLINSLHKEYGRLI